MISENNNSQELEEDNNKEVSFNASASELIPRTSKEPRNYNCTCCPVHGKSLREIINEAFFIYSNSK